MQELAVRYLHFHHLLVENVLSHIERPKLDEHDDYMFAVLHFPIWDTTAWVSHEQPSHK